MRAGNTSFIHTVVIVPIECTSGTIFIGTNMFMYYMYIYTHIYIYLTFNRLYSGQLHLCMGNTLKSLFVCFYVLYFSPHSLSPHVYRIYFASLLSLFFLWIPARVLTLNKTINHVFTLFFFYLFTVCSALGCNCAFMCTLNS